MVLAERRRSPQGAPMTRARHAFSLFAGPLLAGSLALSTFLSGCSPASDHGEPALVALPSTRAALDFVREVSLRRMNRQIDEALRRFDEGEACSYYEEGTL